MGFHILEALSLFFCKQIHLIFSPLFMNHPVLYCTSYYSYNLLFFWPNLLNYSSFCEKVCKPFLNLKTVIIDVISVNKELFTKKFFSSKFCIQEPYTIYNSIQSSKIEFLNNKQTLLNLKPELYQDQADNNM